MGFTSRFNGKRMKNTISGVILFSSEIQSQIINGGACSKDVLGRFFKKLAIGRNLFIWDSRVDDMGYTS